MPVTSLLDNFPEEVHEHISQKKCPFQNEHSALSNQPSAE
jgi:hypothetical protein